MLKCATQLAFFRVCSAGVYKENKKACRKNLQAFCDPDAIRTRDRLLRRQMLYPAELPDHLSRRLCSAASFCECKVNFFF